LRYDHIDMLGDQLVDEPGQAVDFALRCAALEDDRLAVDVAALAKVAHHPGTQNPGVGRPNADQPDAMDFARLGESAGLQQRYYGGGDSEPLEESHDHLGVGLGGAEWYCRP
jgi:hypothetical protein